MPESSKEFRERLLEAETVNPALRQKYEKELRELLEPRITGFKKWFCISMAVFCLAYAAFFSFVVFVSDNSLELPKLFWAMLLPFMVVTAVWLIWLVIKGRESLKVNAAVWLWITLFFFYFLVVVMFFARDVLLALLGILIFILVSGVSFYRLNLQAQLKTREKLLEIEYRLAELAEQLSRK